MLAIAMALMLVQPPPPSVPGPEERAPVGGLRVLWSVPIGSHSFGGGAAADLNGDGACDVVFATYFGDARVRALSGRDGHELWSYHDPNPDRDDCYDASVRLIDATGDGKLDAIVPCSSGCRVLCFEATGGKLQWNTYLGDGDCVDTPPWVGDLDGDGKTEIVVGTFRSRLFALHGSDGSIARTIKVADSGAVQSCPVVVDVNRDGTSDIIAGIFGKKDFGVYAIDGKSGERLWKVETGDHVYHGPAIGHPRDTELTDIVFGSYDGKVYLVDPVSGKPAWSRATGNRYIMAPIALADFDGHGRDSVVFTGDGYGFMNGQGEHAAPVPVSGKNLDTCSRGVSIADLDSDGRLDCAYFTSRGVFRVVRPEGVVREFDSEPLLGEGRKASENSHSPVLADFNGDGLLDAFFVVGGGGERTGETPGAARKPFYGRAVCLTGFQGHATGKNGWYMFRHDACNTGNFAAPLDPSLLSHVPVTAK